MKTDQGESMQSDVRAERAMAVARAQALELEALRAHYAGSAPLRGARIAVLSPVTVHFAVLLETLGILGAELRWAASDRADIEEIALVGTPAAGASVFARSGESIEEFWDFAHRIFFWPDGALPNLLIDEGGKATDLVHLGVAAEGGDVAFMNDPADEDATARNAEIRRRLATRPAFYSALATGIIGCSERTLAGARRVRRLDLSGALLFPVIDVSAGVQAPSAAGDGAPPSHALEGSLIRLALAQIELFANGASYRPHVHGFSSDLKRRLAELGRGRVPLADRLPAQVGELPVPPIASSGR